MFEKTLRKEQTKEFAGYRGIVLAGLSVTGILQKEKINLIDFPYDREIRIFLAYDGQERSAIRLEGRDIKITLEDHREITVNDYLKKVIAGNFTITFKTDCGNPDKDMNVEIFIRPNHEKRKAAITYTCSPAY